MEKKRKTELDIDLDLNVDELLEKKEESPPPPPSSAEPDESEEPEERGPGFLEKLIQKLTDKFKEIPPKILIISAAAVITLLLTIAIIYYIATRPEPPPPPVVEEPVVKEEAPAFKVIPQYEFTPFFFPLQSKDTKEVFLKIAFSFDLSNELVLREIEQNIALLRANLSFALKKKSLSDLESDINKTKLGQEILNVLNRSLQKGTAVKIYFTKFLIK
jgi:flagellar basal body-associated protein FliL